MITEPLGQSLYSALIKNKYSLQIQDLQIILKDILKSLKFLKEVGIIHCDLKPENILLENDRLFKVKLIDFGSALFIQENDQHFEMQTLPYRSPEITLRSDYSFEIDMWSLGCIVYELITH